MSDITASFPSLTFSASGAVSNNYYNVVLDTNLKAESATTQYSNFGYNSMVEFADKFLCAGESGLYELARDYSGDNGSDIIAYFELAMMDFGIPAEKRLRSVYLGYEAAADFTLQILTELGFNASYTVPASTAGQHGKKIIVSRSLRGWFFTFRIYSSSTDFSLDEIRVLPIVRGYRRDQG